MQFGACITRPHSPSFPPHHQPCPPARARGLMVVVVVMVVVADTLSTRSSTPVSRCPSQLPQQSSRSTLPQHGITAKMSRRPCPHHLHSRLSCLPPAAATRLVTYNNRPVNCSALLPSYSDPRSPCRRFELLLLRDP